MRTAAQGQYAALRDQSGGQPRHPLVSTQARIQSRPRGRKGGRVGDHQIERRPLVPQSSQHVKRIALAAVKPVLCPHGHRTLARQIQGGCRPIHTECRSRPARQCRQTKTAHMGKHIQHACALRHRFGKGMVGTLVIEQSRLLPAGDIGHINRPVHRNREWRIRSCADQRRVHIVQPLKTARAATCVLENARRTRHLDRRCGQHIDPHISPGRVGLDDQRIAKAVDDDAGKPISFGMDQPIVRRIKEPVPQVQRPLETRGKPRLIHHRRWIGIDHARDNFGRRVDGGKAQRVAIFVLKHGQRPGL
mmetsp:Transcript_23430/g.41138  ORF Transcript_23430/g.41138 Transcript_23430/m.41138 type:complete len:305 (-) Transcript_23430:3304-4218(-)